jgi:DNA-binding transcriptional MerR regulator
MERTYSIKDLELLSGIKAHTIRIWEQRYDLLHPVRTDTNIRRYSEDDLRLLLNVAILNKKGYKISKIAAFKKDEVAREAYRMLATDNTTEVQMDGLRHAMITLEEEEFNKIFANLTMRYGFEEAMIKVVYPFLELIGVLWQTGAITPLHEHFASSIIRQKIIVALDMLPVPGEDPKKGFVLACPELEYHELGLLFANYIFRSRGYHTVYIGANVPLRDMTLILQESGLANIFISVIVHPSSVDLPGYVKQLDEQLPAGTNIYLSGRQTDSLKSTELPEDTRVLTRVNELTALLEQF